MYQQPVHHRQQFNQKPNSNIWTNDSDNDNAQLNRDDTQAIDLEMKLKAKQKPKRFILLHPRHSCRCYF